MPTSPISWLSGSQLTAMSSAVVARPAGPLIASMLAARFACVITTPLGNDTDPDVNCTNATSSSDGRHVASRNGPSNVSYTSTCVSDGHRSRSRSIDGASVGVVTTPRAWLVDNTI